MALVTKVGYFCTAGHTELGGLNAFLTKINPRLKWVRCFPTKIKEAPKLNRNYPEFPAEQEGRTGNKLVNEMVKRIRAFAVHRQFDLLLLIDDLDCRFNGSELTRENNFDSIQQRVNEAAGEVVSFEVLYASPEVTVYHRLKAL
ncbi:hypothetical protein EFBL_3718 [Effusibacillus lacus]|uniref:Uncharacterized protein n=1 Tax=Effusibacillus lacus TaxID=1348429 RepID=A0A292YLR0_9BACL|nr:hypothetical protein EFBL_3718 [Effusibacillus lacus]